MPGTHGVDDAAFDGFDDDGGIPVGNTLDEMRLLMKIQEGGSHEDRDYDNRDKS